MAKKLSTEDIVEKGLFKEPIEETREFLKVVKELQKEVKAMDASKDRLPFKVS